MLSHVGRGVRECEAQFGSSAVKVGVVTTTRKWFQEDMSLAAC
jgi:hypothetical protein